MKYRVQQRDFNGHIQRGWGFGKAPTFGPWRTVVSIPKEVEAEAMFAFHVARQGLRQTRLVLGAKELRRS